jgi:hypothetical protein
MILEGFRQEGLLATLTDERRRRLDHHFNTELSEAQQLHINEATKDLWEARMPHVEIILDGCMWRALRQEVQHLRTCIEAPRQFEELLSRTKVKLGHADATQVVKVSPSDVGLPF